MLRRFTRRRWIAALAVAVLVGSGVAFAYFTSSGSGTGSAKVGRSSSWTVVPDTATGTMLPGSGDSTFTYTVENPSSATQHLNATSAAVDADAQGDITEDGNAVAGCKASWFHATDTSPAPADVAAGDSVSGSVTVTMDESGTNQDACQGSSPDITVSAS